MPNEPMKDDDMTADTNEEDIIGRGDDEDDAFEEDDVDEVDEDAEDNEDTDEG